MTNIRISIITAVYNRADKVHRVFESLELSTFRNFELVMVDDGSSDNLVDIVEYYRKRVTYPITFIKKKNGGKHTAINLMYEIARGEYIFSLDSDDELMPDAMGKALNVWDNMPERERNKYWCVCGRNVDNNSTIIGELFPDNINNKDFNISRKIASKIRGDKMSLQKLDIVKRYKFPEPKNVTFVTEKIVWNRIDKDYKQYYTNDIFGIVYKDAGNRLSNSARNMQTAINNYFNCLYQINNSYNLNIGIKEYIELQIRFFLNAAIVPQNVAASVGVLNKKHKIFNILIAPIALILLPQYKRKYGVQEVIK
jgi:Glycosyltransferases involved in cell wall biogenesis